MSRDSNYTYIHNHASHHADLFEEFCHPPSSSTTSSSTSQSNANANNNNGGAANGTNTNDPSTIQIPGHFLPFEEIQLPPHLMPLNPEDEDDVVPDMHAAFGIQRALGGGGAVHGSANTASMGGGGQPPGATGEASTRGAQQEPIWRDLGLERLLDGGGTKGGNGSAASGGVYPQGFTGRREGKRTGILLIR